HGSRPYPPPHSSPTRRSSDLTRTSGRQSGAAPLLGGAAPSYRGQFRIQNSEFRTPAGAVSLAGSPGLGGNRPRRGGRKRGLFPRSEEHTSELQSRSDLVCRLL